MLIKYYENISMHYIRYIFWTINVFQITPILKGKMMEVGTLMVGYQPLNEIPNFFRNIISSAAVTKGDVDFLLSELDRLGQDL